MLPFLEIEGFGLDMTETVLVDFESHDNISQPEVFYSPKSGTF